MVNSILLFVVKVCYDKFNLIFPSPYQNLQNYGPYEMLCKKAYYFQGIQPSFKLI